MADPRTERLTNSLMRSELLGPDHTPRFDLLRAEFTDPDGLAQEMVRREWLTNYQADDRQGALDLAAQAYEDHFELAEVALERVDKELKESLEDLIAVQIRRAINTGQPKADVEILVGRATSGLQTAAQALG